MIYWFDLAGTGVFAITGALAAGRKQLDIFGVVVVAMATAVGGGTIRDVLLGLQPVFWLHDLSYLGVGVGCAVATFALARLRIMPAGTLRLADALGLAIFTVVGVEKTLGAGFPAVVAVIMGMITGVFGGIIRDLLCGDVPLILRQEIYATAALAGGAVFIVARHFGLPLLAVQFVTVAVVLAVRMAALHWRLSLPALRLEGREDR